MKEKENNPLLIVYLELFAILLLLASDLMPTLELLIFLFSLGTGFSLFGVALALNIIRIDEKKLKQNKRAALWVWTVCLLALVVLALGWFVLTWPTFMIIDYIETVYTFPPEVTPAITLVKSVMGWFLILMALGLLLWAYVNSQRREEVTYPVG